MEASLKTKWLIYSISGLLLTGFGLSLTGEAIIDKLQNPSSISWVVWGTVALVVFNSGLCLFGQGVLYKARLNQFRERI